MILGFQLRTGKRLPKLVNRKPENCAPDESKTSCGTLVRVAAPEFAVLEERS